MIKQIWNEASGSGGVGLFGRRDYERPVQHIDSSYAVIDAANSTGQQRKNCTGSANCIPKCFAEKGNRGLPGIPGLQGPKGIQGFAGSEGKKTNSSMK